MLQPLRWTSDFTLGRQRHEAESSGLLAHFSPTVCPQESETRMRSIVHDCCSSIHWKWVVASAAALALARGAASIASPPDAHGHAPAAHAPASSAQAGSVPQRRVQRIHLRALNRHHSLMRMRQPQRQRKRRSLHPPSVPPQSPSAIPNPPRRRPPMRRCSVCSSATRAGWPSSARTPTMNAPAVRNWLRLASIRMRRSSPVPIRVCRPSASSIAAWATSSSPAWQATSWAPARPARSSTASSISRRRCSWSWVTHHAAR